MDNTANNTNGLDIDTKLSTMADSINSLGATLAKFSESVVNVLSGTQTHERPKRVAVTPGKKLGRPLGSKNKPKGDSIAPPAPTGAVARAAATPLAIPDAPTADKPLHPTAIELMNRVHKEGRVKVSDLAQQAKVSSSLVHYYLSPLIERGKITVIRYSVGGKRVDVAYKPDRVLIRD